MPVRVENLGNGKVRVSTPGGVKAKSTTPAKAAAQKRIIEAADRKPTGRQPKRRLANNGEPKKWLPGRS